MIIKIDPRRAASPTDPAPETLLTWAETSARLEGRDLRIKVAALVRASIGLRGPSCRHPRNKPFYPLNLPETWARAQITFPACSSSDRPRLKRETGRREAPRAA